jgi:hypothetical protein
MAGPKDCFGTGKRGQLGLSANGLACHGMRVLPACTDENTGSREDERLNRGYRGLLGEEERKEKQRASPSMGPFST